MSAYPDLPLLDESDAELDSGLDVSRASNGRLRLRGRFPAPKASFTLKHWLTREQYAALLGHHLVHEKLAFAFTWPEDGVVRSCCYVKAPSLPKDDGGGYVLVDVDLREV